VTATFCVIPAERREGRDPRLRCIWIPAVPRLRAGLHRDDDPGAYIPTRNSVIAGNSVRITTRTKSLIRNGMVPR